MSADRIGVFIDRDGTLNEERNFLRNPDDFMLTEGAGAAIRSLNERKIPVCVISNQSGIAREFLTEEDLENVHARMEQELKAEGAHVDRIYYCPHHATEGIDRYRIDCSCRKPKPGMLKMGAEDLGIDLSRSFMVGDKLADVEAGIAVGATSILVLTGYGKEALEESKERNINPDHVAPSLSNAVSFILSSVRTEIGGSE